MMVNARIKRLVTFANYADDSFRELFREAGIQVDILEKPSSLISFLE
jgi:dCMP deaminase